MIPTPHTRGLTLVEVLVAIAILAIVLALSSAIITSLTTNGRSRAALGVNQAAQQYIETLTREWLDPARFGTITPTTPRPAPLAGHTWEVTACEVIVPTDASTTFPCAAPPHALTFTPTTPTPTLTPSPAATLMRVTVTYRPTGPGSPLTTTTEFSRR